MGMTPPRSWLPNGVIQRSMSSNGSLILIATSLLLTVACRSFAGADFFYLYNRRSSYLCLVRKDCRQAALLLPSLRRCVEAVGPAVAFSPCLQTSTSNGSRTSHGSR